MSNETKPVEKPVKTLYLKVPAAQAVQTAVLYPYPVPVAMSTPGGMPSLFFMTAVPMCYSFQVPAPMIPCPTCPGQDAELEDELGNRYTIKMVKDSSIT